MTAVNQEVRIASIGNVDSGKSTTISVLSKNIMDNGKGTARENLLKHPHEKTSGRTSSISHSFVKKNDRTFTFIDLAGHEKYLKTTVSGLNGYFIDYGMVVIGADRGIIGMTKEHLIVALSLNIPLFVVITKIDVAIEQKLKNIEKRLTVIFNNKFAGKKEIIFIDETNIATFIKTYNPFGNIMPIFKISNVTGQNLNVFKKFVYNLKPVKIRGSTTNPAAKFVIDTRFKLADIGLVVTGTAREGTFIKDKVYYLGPFGKEYKKITIRSIHNNFKEDINILAAGEGGCFNIKFVNSKDKVDIDRIRKGHMVFSYPSCAQRFEAKIKILHHPTTIKKNYEPTIHCGIVRQVAKIYDMDKPLIRTGDETNASFMFKYRPEYIEVGSKITFREGRTKGIGTVTKVIEIN